VPNAVCEHTRPLRCCYGFTAVIAMPGDVMYTLTLNRGIRHDTSINEKCLGVAAGTRDGVCTTAAAFLRLFSIFFSFWGPGHEEALSTEENT